jgi:hypothetical protein
MRDSWLKLVGGVLRPARPGLDGCRTELQRHLEARRLVAEERARAIADCEARIEGARAAVFAARDGVVTSRMTDLEREWRRLSRPDPEGGWMALWERIAPTSWLDRKRWRDSDPAVRVDAAIALAADADGVEAAEAAIDRLRAALAAWGTAIGARVRWRLFAGDFEGTSALLAEPLRAARDALSARDGGGMVLDGGRRLEADVLAAALARFPDRPVLARALAHAAFADVVWRGASLDAGSNPVTPLRQLWGAGYALSSLGAQGVTVEIPAL